MMEFGNVYEVFHIGDIVKVKDIASIYCGEIGVIVGIKETGYYTEPIYIIRMDEPSLYACDSYGGPTEIQVIAKHLAKAGHIDNQKEITMGVRSCKTAYSAIEKIQDEWADSQIEDMKEMLNKLFGGNDSMKNVDVKKIIFSGLKTIVLWTDGTKTIVSISKDEAKFDPEAAFCAAYTKKMFGTNSKIKRIIKEKSNYEDFLKDKDERIKKRCAMCDEAIRRTMMGDDKEKKDDEN